MRPIYETKQDLVSEKEIITRYCKEFGYDSYKLPIAYKFDYALSDKFGVCALVEIKVRKEKYGTYPTYMISAAKVLEARNWLNSFQIPVLLIVQFFDTPYLTELGAAKGKIQISGRHDRNDSQDIEPCYFIPIQDFTPIY